MRLSTDNKIRREMLGARSDEDRVQESPYPDPNYQVISKKNSTTKKISQISPRRRRTFSTPPADLQSAVLLPDSTPPPAPTRHVPSHTARTPANRRRPTREDRSHPRPLQCFQRYTARYRPTNRRRTCRSRPTKPRVRAVQTLKILQLNVCGLRRRAAEVSMQCQSRDISLACLQETHLKQEDPAPRIRVFIAVARQDREDGYGGTITYARQDLCSKILEHHSHSTAKVQICTVKLRSPRGLLNVSNVYAAPGWLPRDTEWLTRIPDN